MKLTQIEAKMYIDKAFKSMTNAPEIRFGQALFNCIPKETSDIIYMTDKDFFFWSDKEMLKTLDVFFNECVEK